MKLYSIEVDYDREFITYCFVSLLDGARGTYTTSKKEAIEQGEAHQKILCAVHPELDALVKEERGISNIKISVKPSDVYAVKDISMFAHIIVKSENLQGAQGYIILYSPSKTITPEGLDKAQLEFKNIDNIYELIKYGIWVKCANVKEELKTI